MSISTTHIKWGIGATTAVMLIAGAIFTGGYGALSSATRVDQNIISDTLNLSVVGSDSATVDLTSALSDFAPGEYRERLVKVTAGGANKLQLRYRVFATVNADPTLTTLVPGDAVNSVDAIVNVASLSSPPIVSGPGGSGEQVPSGTAGQGGIAVELFTCSAPQVWDGSGIGIDYWCDDAANGVRGATWTQGTLISPTSALDLATTVNTANDVVFTPILDNGQSVTVLVRTMFVNDTTTDGRQDVEQDESITVTHRFILQPMNGSV